MREESAIRRTGMVFILLAFMIQFFAVLSPPVSTSASPDNNMLSGGFSSVGDAATKCNNDVRNYKEILNYYGISCGDLSNGHVVTLGSASNGGQLYSMGYNSYGQHNPTTGRATNQSPVSIPGVPTLYVRLLNSFGTTSYKALRVTSSTGKAYWLLFDCGNLVSVGLPQPAPSAPKPCQYNPAIPASSPKCYNKCQYNPAIPASSPQCYNKCRWNKDIKASDSRCFEHCPIPGKTNLHKSDSRCVGKCPYNTALPVNSPQCFPPCQYNAAIPADSPDCTPTTTTPVCQYNPALPVDSPDCKPCDESINSVDTAACIVIHKTASNITTGTADANNTTAKPGNVITYTLYAKNNGKATVKGFVFQEGLDDVLVYSDATDLHGGTMDSSHNVSWPAVDINSGQTATVQVTIKVKDPVPQTPAGKDDPNHFDLIMTNVYGNTINIHVPGSPKKTVETTAATLPNTGPGTSLFAGAAIVMVAGYFYGRSRLLAKESELALQESHAG